MLHMPTPMFLGGRLTGYQAWLAHLADRTLNVVAWNATLSAFSEGFYRTTANAAPTGNMAGSPWNAEGNRARNNSSISRLIQHGMATRADLEGQINNVSEIIISIVATGSYAGFLSVDRNEFVSGSGGSGFGYGINEVSYWNHTLNKPQTTNPFDATGPVDYSHPGWTP